MWDRSSTHFGPDIDSWLTEHNANSPYHIHMRFISEGMTSIMQVHNTLKEAKKEFDQLTICCQVGDIAINHRIKSEIRSKYDAVRWSRIESIRVGQKFVISRSDLVSMIEETYLQMNKENEKRKWITKAFEKCGQNPFMDEQQAVEILTLHLNSLKECIFYDNIGSSLHLD